MTANKRKYRKITNSIVNREAVIKIIDAQIVPDPADVNSKFKAYQTAPASVAVEFISSKGQPVKSVYLLLKKGLLKTILLKLLRELRTMSDAEKHLTITEGEIEEVKAAMDALIGLVVDWSEYFEEVEGWPTLDLQAALACMITEAGEALSAFIYSKRNGVVHSTESLDLGEKLAGTFLMLLLSAYHADINLVNELVKKFLILYEGILERKEQ